MGANPWDRNEGRFDHPSSAPPCKAATARPVPPPALRLPVSEVFDLGAGVMRIVTVDEIELPRGLVDIPPPVKRYDATPGRRLKRKDR